MKTKNYAQQITGAIFLSLIFMQTGCTATTSPEVPLTPPVKRCLDTPAGVPVDEAGCPKEPVQFSDGDGDGVADYQDLCRHTAAGVTVDEKGCPVVIDKDSDGVKDGEDACPETPALTVVDARGCPVPVAPVVVLPEPVLTLSLEYLPNEATTGAKFVAEMEKIAEFIKANPDRRFVIEGHTDSIGNDAINLKLSRQRAEAIASYLSGKLGIPAALLEARGFGESSPVADNNTQEGRRQNRRIDIIALPQ